MNVVNVAWKCSFKPIKNTGHYCGEPAQYLYVEYLPLSHIPTIHGVRCPKHRIANPKPFSPKAPKPLEFTPEEFLLFQIMES